MADKLLSKSRYLSGLQCKRYLWLLFNEPERVPGPDVATQQIFDQGKLVGELAHTLFPDGVTVPADNFMENIRLTKQYLQQSHPIFEAGIRAGNLFARADILKPSGTTSWDIVEVKGSTAVKDVNIQDAAFQKYCYQQAGLKIDHCYLMHINNKYVRQGKIDPAQFFTSVDITDDVMLALGNVPDRVEEMMTVIRETECPASYIGPHCKDPYDCPLTDCWEGFPEHSVFTLYRAGKKAYELYDRGIIEVTGIPADYKLNEKQHIQIECVNSGEPYLDIAALRQFLATFQYPIRYLDFETINPAVPLFDGTRPYQQVPFQFSLNVQNDTTGALLGAESFLADGPQDPRPAFLAHLRKVIGNTGSIAVYNQSFEESILRELGNAFPEYAKWVEGVISRMVDLLVPFRDFSYYHPAQKGSASLKYVLPALTNLSYNDLEIAEGNTASLKFLESISGNISDEEHKKIRTDLLIYCGQDTGGMVEIIKSLRYLTEGS